MFNDIFLIFTIDTPLKNSKKYQNQAKSKNMNKILKNVKIKKPKNEQIFKKYQNQTILKNLTKILKNG